MPYIVERICAHCGAAFTYTVQGSGNVAHYCPACPDKVRRRRPPVPHQQTCLRCGQVFQTTTRRLYCDDDCRRKEPRQCEHCGRTYLARCRDDQGEQRFCSYACYWDSRTEERAERAWQVKARRAGRILNRWKQCPSCGLWHHKQGRHCSYHCGTHSQRICDHCGVPYEAKTSVQRYHSLRCMARAQSQTAKARRRAQAKGSPIRRAYIFKRDGYRCYLCGGRLAMTKQVPHPQAPTLDHVIPLARGGSHSEDNLRAAHHACNVAKGTKAVTTQLMLIG